MAGRVHYNNILIQAPQAGDCSGRDRLSPVTGNRLKIGTCQSTVAAQAWICELLVYVLIGRIPSHAEHKAMRSPGSIVIRAKGDAGLIVWTSRCLDGAIQLD